jgi:hypothetical protein
MTDEEHEQLLEELRDAAFYRGPEFAVCDKAANEIERLAILAHSNAGSVASAGLIEAAEWLEHRATWHEIKVGHTTGEQGKHHKSAAREDRQAAKLLRARAANRSTK